VAEGHPHTAEVVDDVSTVRKATESVVEVGGDPGAALEADAAVFGPIAGHLDDLPALGRLAKLASHGLLRRRIDENAAEITESIQHAARAAPSATPLKDGTSGDRQRRARQVGGSGLSWRKTRAAGVRRLQATPTAVGDAARFGEERPRVHGAACLVPAYHGRSFRKGCGVPNVDIPSIGSGVPAFGRVCPVARHEAEDDDARDDGTVPGLHDAAHAASAAATGSPDGEWPCSRSRASRAARHVITLRRVEEAPIRPKRHVFPAIFPRPPPISMP
jgi:hypothetical protein